MCAVSLAWKRTFVIGWEVYLFTLYSQNEDSKGPKECACYTLVEGTVDGHGDFILFGCFNSQAS